MIKSAKRRGFVSQVAKMDVDSSEKSSDSVNITQPELLSREVLLEHLRNHNVGPTQTLDKSDLLALYYKTLAPLPQRKYRTNRRGREMTIKQRQHEKLKRKHDEIDGDKQNTSYRVQHGSSVDHSQSSRLVSSFSLPQVSGDRLKPPITPVKFERKTINLSSSKSSNSCSSNSKVTVNDTRQKTDGDCAVKSPTKITLNKMSPQTVQTAAHKVKLQRKSVQNNSQPATNTETLTGSSSKMSEASAPVSEDKMDTSNSDNGTECVRKKFKRIDVKWP